MERQVIKMKYISVGCIIVSCPEKIIQVSHCGHEFSLVNEFARMWLSGRFGFSETENYYEEKAVKQLHKMGLVHYAGPGSIGEYRALTKCRIVPAKRKNPYAGLYGKERTLMKWVLDAVLVLTMGELVFLMERGVAPEPSLLGPQNQQRLVEIIYTKNTIFDNILENQMELADARDETVKLILNLLKRKRIVLL